MYRNLHSENSEYCTDSSSRGQSALAQNHSQVPDTSCDTIRGRILCQNKVYQRLPSVRNLHFFYIGILGLIDWTSGSRRDKTWVLVLAGYTFSKVARHAFCLVAQPSWSAVTLWGVSRDRWSARNTMQYVTNLKLVLESLCVPVHNILDRKTSTKLTTFVELT